MLHVYINDRLLESPSPLTLAQLCEQEGITIEHVAIALNQTFVPRNQYAAVQLQHQDKIDVVSAMQGG